MAKKKVESAEVKPEPEKSFEERTGVKLVDPADIAPAIVEDPGNGKSFDERTSPLPPYLQDK